MDFGLTQRVALVTGASSGLGLAIARALAAEGCAVAMVARRAELLEREARDIVAQSKGRALPITGDVTKPEDVARVTSQAAAMLGPIDILIANAGGPPSTTFATTTDEQYESALELNLLASIRLARAVVPAMRERRWGRVIFVSSMAAKQPLAGLLLSNTARAGTRRRSRSGDRGVPRNSPQRWRSWRASGQASSPASRCRSMVDRSPG